MKNQALITVLIAAGAGCLGAVVSQLFLAPDSGPRQEVSRSDALLTSLERSLEGLQSTDSELLERLVALEQMPPVIVTSERIPVSDGPLQAGSIQDSELQALVASLKSDAPVPDNFVAVVGSALDEIRAQEEAQRDEERLQRTIDGIEERLGKLEEDLGLSSYQVDEMRPVLLEQSLARNELMEAARENGDWGNIRSEMRELGKKADESLSLILTPEQLEGYEDSSRRDFGGRRGGGGGGGNTGGGGNAGGNGQGGGGRRGGRDG